MLLSEPLNKWSLIGATLVTSCAFVNPLKQWYASTRPAAPLPSQSTQPDAGAAAIELTPSQSRVHSAQVGSSDDGNEDDNTRLLSAQSLGHVQLPNTDEADDDEVAVSFDDPVDDAMDDADENERKHLSGS